MTRSLFKFLLPFPLLLTACDSSDERSTGESSVRKAQQALTPEEERTIRFEAVSDWAVWSGQGTIENDTLSSEGTHSLEVVATGTTDGYVGVRNVTPLTKDDQPAPEVVGFDVWIPSAQLNPYWHGDTQLYIDAPSAGVWQQYLGYRSFQDLPKDQFVRVEFPVPDWIRQALDSSAYTDLRFVIAVNTTPGNPAHYLDDFTLGPNSGDPTCTPTDDGNPCTADECNPATGQTTHVPLAPGALCGDGNVCNGTETCDGAGSCQAGTPLDVDDGNPCTTDSCDAASGVTNTPVAAGTACDDGDVCNGAEFCDAEGACQDAPDLDADDGNPCTTDTCDPVTGVSNDPVAEGTSCADGDVCNGEELCDAAGACQAGTPLTVDDGNVCTTDSCDPVSGVSNDPVAEGTSCDDGNVCNGVSTCDATASCVAGTPPTVDDGNECTADSCDPATGVSNIPVSAGVSCGDGDACNGDDVCNGAGACVSGDPPDIDDGNPCTADACDPSGGVTHTPVSAGVSCEDGNLCNGAETCDGAGACQAGTPVETDDGNECTIGSCDPATGAIAQDPVPAGAACGDGDLCNGSEFCDGDGVCEAGTPPTVDDGNACTADSCDPLFGVENTPVSAGASCGDGNACNGEEICDGAGACQSGDGPSLDDGNPCTVDACDAGGGVTHTPVPAGTTCFDGDVCNGSEVCNGSGQCLSGSSPVVDDNNPCTADACDPTNGVSHTPVSEGTPCDDGLQCNGTNLCNATGACTGFEPPPFDDNNACTFYQCDEVEGPRHVPLPAGLGCPDGDQCNGAETCDGAGTCASGTPPAVDDGNPCTADSCDAVLGVRHEPVPNGTSCDDQSLCTEGDTCQAGVCSGTSILPPVDLCTTASCDPATGEISETPVAAGTSCESTGTLCDGEEVCDGAGACVAGTPVEVDDGNPCTIDVCNGTTGDVSHDFVPAGFGCSDGNACNGAELCDGAGTCEAGTPINFDDDNLCTIDSCDPETGEVDHVPAPLNSMCSDGNVCNGAELCDGAGTCQAGTPLDVDDGNACTVDTCDPLFGIDNDPVPAGQSCEDSNVCNGSEACDAFGECQTGSPVDVDDGNACTFDSCDPTDGVSHDNEPSGTPCGEESTCNGSGMCRECDPAGLVDTCGEGQSCSPGFVCVSNEVTLVAPPLPQRKSLRTGELLSFLYSGLDPVQRDVQPGALEEGRISGLRGRVVDEAGVGVVGVLIDFPDFPELGFTFTQDDGGFDLVANGGGAARLRYRLAGRLPAQRTVRLPLESIVNVDDVVLVPFDEDVQVVQLGSSSMQAVEDTVTGTRGTRRHTALFAANTTAEAVLGDGSRVPLSELDVRITEYTVGAQGPARMPASLPHTSQYTLAFEASVDQAIELGAETVEFGTPVVHHVDNFLGFDVGTVVPVGYLDRDAGVWKAEKNGRIVGILAIENGRAVLDVDGDGLAATSQQLDEIGYSDDEAVALGAEYAVGASLMRAQLSHFSSFDYNWPSRPIDTEAGPPGQDTGPILVGGVTDEGGPGPNSSPTGEECSATAEGSLININKRTVAEEVPLVGVGMDLRHDSAHFAKNPNELIVIATEAFPPTDLETIKVTIAVGGRLFTYRPPAGPNAQVEFHWDGKDAYGREMYGPQAVSVEIIYTFPTYYVEPPGGEFGFARYSPRPFLSPLTRADVDVEYSRIYAATIVPPERQSTLDDVASLGGWMLTEHHGLDLTTGLVTRGDGYVQSGTEAFVAKEEASFPPTPFACDSFHVADGLDGTLYCGTASNGFLRKRRTDTGFSPWFGDSTSVCESFPEGDVVGPETCITQAAFPEAGPQGDFYFVDRLGSRYVIRRVDRAGRIHNVAGHLSAQACPDPCTQTNVPASDVRLWNVQDMRVTDDGTILIVERWPAGEDRDYSIRQIVPGGRASFVDTTVEWDQIYSADQDRRGDIYILGNPAGGLLAIDLYRLTSGGTFEQLTGTGAAPVLVVEPRSPLWQWNVSPYSDQGELPENIRIRSSSRVVPTVRVDGADRVFLMDGTRIRSFFPGGPVRVDTVQSFPPTFDADFAPAGTAFHHEHGYSHMEIGARGLVVTRSTSGIANFERNNGIYRRASAVGGIGNVSAEYAVASETDASQTFVFDQGGRHVRTVHTHLGTTLRQFSYDVDGRLVSIADAHGRTAEIERDANGTATAIVGVHGQRTELFLDSLGRLELVDLPDGTGFEAAYEGSTKLLEEFTDRSGRTSVFAYDQHGRLVSDQSYDLGVQTLTRQVTAEGDVRIRHSSALGLTRTVTEDGRKGSLSYFSDRSPAGDVGVREIDPDGTIRSTAPDGTSTTVERGPDEISLAVRSVPERTTTILPESGQSRVTTYERSVVRDDGVLESTNQNVCLLSSDGSLCTETDYKIVAGIRTTTTPAGRITTEILDSLERLTELRAPGAPTVRTVFDGADVTAIVIDPDGVEGSGDERETQMTYDPVTGLLASVIDPLTNETLFGNYDGADRPQTITLPDSAQVAMTYDPDGNVASVTPPGKAAHGMTYGPRGRIESYTPPVGNGVQFFYDQDRRMDLIDFGLDAFSQPNQVDFEYDPATGQLSTITSPTGVINVGFTNGHMTSLSAPSMGGTIVTSIDYDGFLPTSLSWAGPVAGEVNWTYNDRFLIETETIGALPDTTVTYQYDDDGLVTQAGDLEIVRDPASGRVVQKTIGRIRETFEYNEFAELSRQTVEFMEADLVTVRETLYDVVYDDDGLNGDRDALGRITKKTEWIVDGDLPNGDGTPRPLASRTYDYGYNQHGRPWLESVAVDGNVVSSYSYDDNGNRTAVDLSWSQLGYDSSFDVSLTEADTLYDSADKLLQYGTKSYTWNNFGQLASMTDSDPNGDGDTSDSETTFYAYDLYGNLLRVDLPDGRAIEYDVDGAGRRVGRRELDVDGNEISFRGWIYRGGTRVAAELDSVGTVLVRYEYPYPGFVNVPSVAAVRPGQADERRYRLIVDQVGTVVAAFDTDTGETALRTVRSAFGVVLETRGQIALVAGFAGGLVDKTTGLLRFGARDYIPEVATWTASDRARFASRGTNLYQYALGDPVGFFDPFGKDIWIEGPSQGEPEWHQSINIGDPHGDYESYSFGNDDWGSVYEDTSLGGPIEDYFETTPEQDVEARDWILDNRDVDNEDWYGPNTCRTYSQEKFDKLRRRFGAEKQTPPHRVPASRDWWRELFHFFSSSSSSSSSTSHPGLMQ